MMIFSLLLRNFKTYQGINYIALSNGSKFSALVGENGAGKSSVLEALDSYFNGSEWNFNHTLSKGFQEREPFVCPVFLIEKSNFQIPVHRWLLEKLSETSWKAKPTDFNPSGKTHAELFCQQRQEVIKLGFKENTHYLFPFGIQKTSRAATTTPYFSIFETLKDYAGFEKYASYTDALIELQKLIHNYYKFIYLPSELDFKEHTKLESRTMQALLGQKIDKIVRHFIDKNIVTDINTKLSEFLDGLSERLITYEYRKPALKQSLVNLTHFTETIIESYFGSKVLNKKVGKDTVPVADLSSGEKRQALIDVAQAFLTSSAHNSNQQLILAIDEPELSLHVSACFSQFEKLRDVAESGVQVMVTTHWYGFMPIVSNGVAVYCPKTDGGPVLIDLRCFREDIKKLRQITSGRLPTELELKGTNDLVQSIVASITASDYKWVICEGSADKIYLDHYLKDEGYLIVAVGGSPALKKIYTYIELAVIDARDDINGSVFMLLDTDKKYERFDTKDSIKSIQIRRVKNNEETQRTELITTGNNDFHPATVIEDTLIPRFFLKALESLKDEAPYAALVSKLVKGLKSQDEEMPPSFALNLRRLEIKTLDDLFEMAGFKVKFALRYIELADIKERPAWMNGITDFLSPKTINSKPAIRRKKATKRT